jgi:hypothetical protein
MRDGCLLVMGLVVLVGVLAEADFVAETQRAEVALKGQETQVDPQVSLQSPLLAKGTMTVFTLKWLLTCVNQSVAREGRETGKELPTDVTRKGLVAGRNGVFDDRGGEAVGQGRRRRRDGCHRDGPNEARQLSRSSCHHRCEVGSEHGRHGKGQVTCAPKGRRGELGGEVHERHHLLGVKERDAGLERCGRISGRLASVGAGVGAGSIGGLRGLRGLGLLPLELELEELHLQLLLVKELKVEEIAAQISRVHCCTGSSADSTNRGGSRLCQAIGLRLREGRTEVRMHVNFVCKSGRCCKKRD